MIRWGAVTLWTDEKQGACQLPPGFCERPDPDGADLKPLRTVVRQLGDVPRLRQSRGVLRSSFSRPWLPAIRAVADAVVGNGCEQRINQRRAILRPGSFNLRGKCRQGLLRSFETDLARLGVIFVGGHGHDRAE